MRKAHFIYISFLISLLGCGIVSCQEQQSYSDLLKEEEKATNWYLAQQTIDLTIPEDSVFQTGSNAPFYKMDEDGYLYMQVINPGEKNNRPKLGDVVYIRYSAENIKYMYEGVKYPAVGNTDNVNSASMGPQSIIYGNLNATSSRKFGSGMQTPLNFLGYNCEVNLVLRSYYGFESAQSSCIPYLVNVKYFKAEY